MNDDIKHLLDWTAVGTTVASFFKLLPDIASLLTVVWLGLRVWETDTVKGWTGRK